MKSCPHCHEPLGKVRSPQDHRRFFGLISAAYKHWPEGHEFQPDSAEHLRAWLLMKAGYRTLTTIEPDYASGDPQLVAQIANSIRAALRAADGYPEVRVHHDRIGVFAPKSIAWDKLDQKDFGPLRDAVEEIITAEIGIEADKLLTEDENVA